MKILLRRWFLFFFPVFLFPLISAGLMQIGVKSGYDTYWFTNPDKDMHFMARYSYSYPATCVGITLRQHENVEHEC